MIVLSDNMIIWGRNKMVDKKHTFKYAGRSYGDDKIFLVRCKETKGEFSTEMWRLGKIDRNKCPCCKMEIRK